MNRSTRIAAVLAALSLLPVAAARPLPHDGLHEMIQEAGRRIAKSPTDGSLYLQRAELYRLHEDWDRCFLDFERARELGAEALDVELGRARLFQDLKWFRSAERSVDLVLAGRPEDGTALLLRASILEGGGQGAAAVQAYTEALARLDPPQPEHFVARARATAALGAEHVPAALAGLDEGMALLGAVSSLQLYAIELELGRGHHDDALARLETVAVQSKRKEQWLARRGEILESAGRREEARAAYRASLDAIGRLKPRHRRTQAVIDLEAAVRAALGRLAVEDTGKSGSKRRRPEDDGRTDGSVVRGGPRERGAHR